METLAGFSFASLKSEPQLDVTFFFSFLESLSKQGIAEETCQSTMYLDMWCESLVCSANSRCGRRSWSGGWCWTEVWGRVDHWSDQWPSRSPDFHCGSLSNHGWLRWRSSGTGGGCLGRKPHTYSFMWLVEQSLTDKELRYKAIYVKLLRRLRP